MKCFLSMIGSGEPKECVKQDCWLYYVVTKTLKDSCILRDWFVIDVNTWAAEHNAAEYNNPPGVSPPDINVR